MYCPDSTQWCWLKTIYFTRNSDINRFRVVLTEYNELKDQWSYRGTLDFLVYRAGNVDTLVTNDISISQLGIEIFRSEK